MALDVPITNDKQSAHLRITGTLTDPAYTVEGGDLVFARTMKGLRNTVLLPAGWDVSAVSQSATIGQHDGRAFVALINLNAENQYAVRIRARRASSRMRSGARRRSQVHEEGAASGLGQVVDAGAVVVHGAVKWPKSRGSNT